MRISSGFIVLILCLPTTLWVSAQSTIDQLDAQRMDVVKLRSKPSDRAAETAAGVYVGKDQQNAYFVTALHPLRNRKDGDDYNPVKTVDLQFYSGPVGSEAQVFEHYDAVLDLAVVYIPISRLPTEMVSMPRIDAIAELAIHIIGHPPAGDWSAWTGRIQNELNVAGDSNFFSTGLDSSLTNGYSGAPVLDSNGSFVGIHLSGEKSYSRNLKSDAIVKLLKDWRVPITNLVGSGVELVGTWRGPNGKAFLINGRDAVEVPDRPGFDLPNGSSWTLEAWVYPIDSSRGMHIAGKRGACQGGDGFYQIAIDVNAPGTGMSVDPQYAPAHTWTHVAIAANGEGWKSYANGRLVKTVSSPGWRIQNSGRFLIGGVGNCPRFKGAIDEVSLYGRELSAGEIQSTYSSQRSEVLRDSIEH